MEEEAGTEHLIDTFTDKVLKMLECWIVQERAAVLASAVYWTAAFDRIDTTILSQKFIKIGIRSSPIPILISYISDRELRVKYKNIYFSAKSLVGGSPHSTWHNVSGFSYNVASSDNCEQSCDNLKCFSCQDTGYYPESEGYENAFSYYDFKMLELIILSDNIKPYDVFSHVPSDVTTEQLFLHSQDIEMQRMLNNISNWSNKNKMMINERKTKFMPFSRSKSEFTSRLYLNEAPLE